MRERRAELGLGLHGLAVVDRDVVEADRGAVALGEAHEVLHRPGVVDAPGLLGARVDLVAAGVEVVVDAARDQVGALHLALRRRPARPAAGSWLKTTRRPSPESAGSVVSSAGSTSVSTAGGRGRRARTRWVGAVAGRESRRSGLADVGRRVPDGRLLAPRRRRPRRAARRTPPSTAITVTASDDPERASAGRSAAAPVRRGGAREARSRLLPAFFLRAFGRFDRATRFSATSR